MSHVLDLADFVTGLESQVVPNVTAFRPINVPETPCAYNRFRLGRFEGRAVGIKNDFTTVTCVLGVEATDGQADAEQLLALADEFIDLIDPIVYAAIGGLPSYVALARRLGWNDGLDLFGDTPLRIIEFPVEFEVSTPIQ